MMKLTNHTIYFDITQYCNVGCDFCMYGNKHSKKMLQLSKHAMENIHRIFAWEDIKRVSISGEGEPLTNLGTIWEILALSPGKRNFEIITSGSIPYNSLLLFYKELEASMEKKDDLCNIRLSTDSFHHARINSNPHLNSIKFFLEHHPSHLSLSFRSIDIDKQFIKNFLTAEVQKIGFEAKFKKINTLDEIMYIGEYSFPISYKNLVKPQVTPDIKYMTYEDYLDALEEKYLRPFTFGALNLWPQQNGLDITIKPDGAIIFYGIDMLHLGNLHTDNIDLNFFMKFFEQKKFLYDLYTIPFRELMRAFINEDKYDKIIKKVNNPYWVLPELAANNQNFLW